MRRTSHPWGSPPWTIDFRPAVRSIPERVDFAIVGAGFAGLSAAAWLARLASRKSVVVLESESIGNGASGRTGGMVLDHTAAGPLPGLGSVLSAYQKILVALKVEAELALPGAWELARRDPLKGSPICWNDSGKLVAVARVPGGSVNPGKVISGLARAAERAGAQIIENAEVLEIDSPPSSPKARHGPVQMRLETRLGHQEKRIAILADQVLLATNAGSLELSGLTQTAESKLTLALATEPLAAGQIRALGLTGRQPFYTVDFPYLWGRLLENNGIIFGAGLLPRPTSGNSPFGGRGAKSQARRGFGHLLRFDVRKGATRECFDRLESRVEALHPALKDVRITHRWGGPILFTRNFRPVFRHHPRNKNVLVLGGFCGHGVALSVYLGHRAAQVMLGLRPLPGWAQAGSR
jgi:glycine/D-amino acid oxidase-like deaminating enzyme